MSEAATTRRRYKYIYRVDANLVDNHRLSRLERVKETLGEATKTGTINTLIDEKARQLGVFDEPQNPR